MSKWNENVLWARDGEQLREIGKDLIKDAKLIARNKSSIKIKDKHTKQIVREEVNVDTYRSKDKTINIGLRDNSQSGGPTIDIQFGKKIKTEIHSIKDLRK